METDAPFGPTLLQVWKDYRQAAARARVLKKRLQSGRLRIAMLGIAGAACGAMVIQSSTWSAWLSTAPWIPSAFGAGGAVCLGLVAVFSQHVLRTGFERDWVLLRSIAEALKSEAFIFMAQVRAHGGVDGEDRLSSRAKKLLGNGLPGLSVSIAPQDEIAGLPENWLSDADYIRLRVQDQIERFYRPQSLNEARKVVLVRRTAFLLGVIGAGLGGFAAVDTDSAWAAAWIGVIGTTTGAVAAYLYAERSEYLATSYDLTARRLDWLIVDWQRQKAKHPDASPSEFIVACEQAISVENAAWVAEWTTDTKAQNAAPDGAGA